MFNKLIVYHNDSIPRPEKSKQRLTLHMVNAEKTDETKKSPDELSGLDISIQKQLLEMYNHLIEVAGGDGMSNSQNYDKLIDRLDQDLRDHKQEIRDRDAKLQSDMQEREERTRAELKEREERFRAESKEREERLIKIFDDMKNDLKSLETKIDNRLSQVEQKVDNTNKHISSITIATISMAVATVLAIAALVVTVVLTK